MIKKYIYLGMSCMLVLTGCAGPRVAVMPATIPLGRDIQSFDASSDDVERSVSAEAPERLETVALRQALALALMRNPELQAFSHDVRATEARSLQARLLPNPEVAVEVAEFDRGGEGFDAAESSIVLGQVIELGGKRRWRTRVAEAEGELSGWDYESKRLDVFTRTVQRFTAVIAAQRRLELVESAVTLAEQTSQAVGERVKAGKEPPVQSTKAGAALAMARLDVLDAEDSLVVSRKRLAAMWGSEQPHFQNVSGDLDHILDVLPSVKVLRQRLSSNPDLAREDAKLKLFRAALASEKAERVPSFEATIGLQSFEEDGTDALVFGIGLPLPLFDRNQGNVAAAKHELAKKWAERKAAETELAVELSEIHAKLTSAHRRVLTLKSKVVPSMKEAFDAAHVGYGQGKFGFLDVLDAQRGLIAARSNLLAALSDYHTAVADIQRITGTSIDELLETKKEKKQ